MEAEGASNWEGFRIMGKVKLSPQPSDSFDEVVQPDVQPHSVEEAETIGDGDNELTAMVTTID